MSESWFTAISSRGNKKKKGDPPSCPVPWTRMRRSGEKERKRETGSELHPGWLDMQGEGWSKDATWPHHSAFVLSSTVLRTGKRTPFPLLLDSYVNRPLARGSLKRFPMLETLWSPQVLVNRAFHSNRVNRMSQAFGSLLLVVDHSPRGEMFLGSFVSELLSHNICVYRIIWLVSFQEFL